MKASEIKEKIKKLEKEISELKKTFAEIVPPCTNQICSFYDTKQEHHCTWGTWTNFILECEQYKSDE